MRIERAKKEALKLGKICQKFPDNVDQEHWSRLSYYRTIILQKLLKSKKIHSSC